MKSVLFKIALLTFRLLGEGGHSWLITLTLINLITVGITVLIMARAPTWAYPGDGVASKGGMADGSGGRPRATDRTARRGSVGHWSSPSRPCVEFRYRVAGTGAKQRLGLISRRNGARRARIYPKHKGHEPE